jgi:tagatose-6-phosphate ketose/aldose isomerase
LWVCSEGSNALNTIFQLEDHSLAIPSIYPTDSLLAFEIAQQPQLWPTTLDRVLPYIALSGAACGPVILCGAGTSAYAASAIQEAWPAANAIATTDLLVKSATEIESALPALRRGGLLISLARSGDSPESTGVVAKIQKLFPRVKHLAIVCNPDGRLAHIPGVEVLLLDPRTSDRSLAMTGSFSNLTLAGLALEHRQKLLEHLPDICSRVERTLLERHDVVAEIARACSDRIVVLSSAMQALARETALKILELTDGRVLALSETFLGLRHGAVGFVREETPVLCFMSSDARMRRYEENLIEDLRGKGLGRMVVIGDDPSKASARDWFIPAVAPELPDRLRTPFEVFTSQLLAYRLSVSVGIDPDNPSPKGTITRVVRPFRLYPEPDTAL